MKFFLTICLFWVMSVEAQVVRGLDSTIKLLSEVSRTGKTLKVNQCHSLDGELLQKCALELCGKPKTSPSAAIVDFNIDQYASPEAMREFEELAPELEKTLRSELARSEKFVSEFRRKMKSEGLELEFGKWETYDFDRPAWKFFDRHIQFKVDKTKPIADRLSVELDFPKDASEKLRRGIAAFAEMRKKKINTNFSNGIYGDLYTLEEAKKIFNERWQALKQEFEALKSSRPEIFEQHKDSLKALEDKLGADTPKDLESLGPLATDLELLELNLQGSKTGDWGTYHADCEGVCQEAVQEKLATLDLGKLLSGLEQKPAERDALVKRRMTYCKSEAASMAIKDYDQEKLRDEIPVVINAIEKNVLSKYSEDSARKFRARLDELNIVTSPEKSDLPKFLEELKDKIKESGERPEEEYQKLSKKDFVLRALDFINWEEKADPFNNRAPCASDLSFAAWDAFIPEEFVDEGKELHDDLVDKKDNVLASAFSCTHVGHGKGILAHEIGHVLSWAFLKGKLSSESGKEFAKLRTCATGLHKSKPNLKKNEFLHHEGDQYRTEEDTADLLAFQALPDKNVIFQCALLIPSMDGESYDELELFNSMEEDNHSAPLLRVLQEAAHKRVVPPASCTELMALHKDDFRFEPCF